MAGVASAPATLNASGSTPRATGLTSNYQTACAITVNRTGFWVVQVRHNFTDTSFGPDSRGSLRVLVNGADGGTATIDAGGSLGFTGMPLSLIWASIAGSGTVFTCQLTAMDSSFGARNATGYIDAWFVPTPDYRI